MSRHAVAQEMLAEIDHGYQILSCLMQVTIRGSFCVTPQRRDEIQRNMPEEAEPIPVTTEEFFEAMDSMTEDFMWQNQLVYALYRKLQRHVSESPEIEDLPCPFVIELWPWDLPFTCVTSEVHKHLRWQLVAGWEELPRQYRIDREKHPVPAATDVSEHVAIPLEARIPLDIENEVAKRLAELKEVGDPIRSYLVCLKGKPPIRKREAPLQNAILKVLSTTLPMSPSEIVKALDNVGCDGKDAVVYNDDSVRRACRVLLKKGFVTQPQPDDGLYLRKEDAVTSH